MVDPVTSLFINAGLKNSYSLDPLGTLSDTDAEKYLLDEFNMILGYNSPETLKTRHKRFLIPGTKAEDYRQIIMDVEGAGRQVLAGIRHVGGNTERPFIFIWPNFELQTEAELDGIAKRIVPCFRVFKPLHLNFWLSPTSELNLTVQKKLSPVQRIYTGRIDHILDRSKPDGYGRGVLVPVEDDSYYSWYRSEYDHFHRKNPELRDWIPCNSRELMEESRNEGLLFYYRIEKRTTGLIAAERRRFFNREALYIDEILVGEGFRGEGYAPVMMRKLVEAAGSGSLYLWSHIDNRNSPSIRTALRTGQKPVSVEYFLPIS